MHRKALALTLILCLAATPALATCGDVDGSQSIDVVDALYVAQSAALLPIGFTLPVADADVDGSGAVDITDALLIAQSAAGIVGQLTCVGPPLPPPPPAGQRIYVATNFADQIVVIDHGTNTISSTIPLPESPVSIAADPVRDRVYVGMMTQGRVQIIETGTDTLGSTFTVPGLTGNMRVSPDGTYLVGDASGSVVVWDLQRQVWHGTVATNSFGWENHFAITPDSTRAFVTLADLNAVAEIDLTSPGLVRTIPVGATPWGISIDPTGGTAWVINHGEQTLTRLDITTGTEVMPRNPVGAYPVDVVAHTNGNAYAVNCLDSQVGEHAGQGGQLQGNIPTGPEPMEIEQCDDGALVVGNSMGFSASILDPSGSIPAVTIPLGGNPVEPAVK